MSNAIKLIKGNFRSAVRPYWYKIRGVQYDPFASTSIKPLLFLGEGLKNMTVAEIGVFEGSSSVAMLTRWNVSQFFAVDLWKPYPEYLTFEDSPTTMSLKEEDGELEYRKVRRRLKKYSNVTILRQDSISAANTLPDSILDFCFIDANHEYKYVVDDINAWRPKVKKGGILAGHDYFYDPVRTAVGDTLEKIGIKIFDSGIHKSERPLCWYAYL